MHPKIDVIPAKAGIQGIQQYLLVTGSPLQPALDLIGGGDDILKIHGF